MPLIRNDIWFTKDGDLAGDLLPPAYPGDAGMDVVVTKAAFIAPHSVAQVPIGIRVAPPDGLVFTFMTRSSAVRRGLFVVPTLIDNGYRGPLFIFVMNITDTDQYLAPGNRIAQIVLLPNMMGGREVEEVKSLPVSERGEKGFGSSGGAL